MKKILAATLCALAAFSAQAAQVNALPDGTLFSVPITNIETGGPQTLAPGIIWSSEDPTSLYGYTNNWGFANNGSWNGLSLVTAADGTSTMTLSFSAPVAAVGAFLNYAPFDYGNATIAVYDQHHTLLELTTLTFTTDGSENSGEFHGFKESSSNISYFTMSGGYIAASEFRVLSALPAAPVPEPDTYAMLLAGLGLLGVAARRIRRNQA